MDNQGGYRYIPRPLLLHYECLINQVLFSEKDNKVIRMSLILASSEKYWKEKKKTQHIRLERKVKAHFIDK